MALKFQNLIALIFRAHATKVPEPFPVRIWLQMHAIWSALDQESSLVLGYLVGWVNHQQAVHLAEPQFPHL